MPCDDVGCSTNPDWIDSDELGYWTPLQQSARGHLWRRDGRVGGITVGTLAYVLFLSGGDASILGDIPTGLPDPQLPTFESELLPQMIQSALTLAALGSIDSLLTSLVADNVTRTYHKSDWELIGQGIGNAVAGFVGGLPGAGATMRTVVNVKAGGKTPISGAPHALVLLAIDLGAGALASRIPHAVLAGILIKVGTDIIDWDYLKRIRTAPMTGITIMGVVLFMTVFIDLIIAVGMAMTGMVFMKLNASAVRLGAPPAV